MKSLAAFLRCNSLLSVLVTVAATSLSAPVTERQIAVLGPGNDDSGKDLGSVFPPISSLWAPYTPYRPVGIYVPPPELCKITQVGHQASIYQPKVVTGAERASVYTNFRSIL
jgi:hypothetical protein